MDRNPDANWAEVGRRLRDRIDELGMTKAEVMRRSGVSDKTLNAYLNGTPIVRVDKRRGLTTAMRWSPDSIDRILRGEAPVDQRQAILAADWDDDRGGGYDAGRRVTMGDREWAYVQEHAEEMRTLEQAILHLLRYLSAPNRHRVLEYIAALGQEEEGHRLLTLEEWRDRVIHLLAEQEVRAEQGEAQATPTTNDLVTPEYEKAKKRPRKRRGEAARDVG